jgi:hypothetical protein
MRWRYQKVGRPPYDFVLTLEGSTAAGGWNEENEWDVGGGDTGHGEGGFSGNSGFRDAEYIRRVKKSATGKNLTDSDAPYEKPRASGIARKCSEPGRKPM